MSGYSIRSLLLLLCGLISLTTQKDVPDAFRLPPSEAVDNVNPSALPLAHTYPSA
jgi:hypothetical protein